MCKASLARPQEPLVEYNILSNFHPSAIEYDGIWANSAEQLYQHKIHKHAGNKIVATINKHADKTVATDFMKTTDPARIKNLGDSIPSKIEGNTKPNRYQTSNQNSYPRDQWGSGV